MDVRCGQCTGGSNIFLRELDIDIGIDDNDFDLDLDVEARTEVEVAVVVLTADEGEFSGSGIGTGVEALLNTLKPLYICGTMIIPCQYCCRHYCIPLSQQSLGLLLL
jgi:hypothetical protein